MSRASSVSPSGPRPGGGDRLSSGSTSRTGTFTKRGTTIAIAAEAAGLRELAAAARAGGAPVVRLMGSNKTSLQTARLTAEPPSPRAADTFGRLLAITHAFCPDGQRVFGQAPAGLHDDGVMGEAPLPLVFAACSEPGADSGVVQPGHKQPRGMQPGPVQPGGPAQPGGEESRGMQSGSVVQPGHKQSSGMQPGPARSGGEASELHGRRVPQPVPGSGAAVVCPAEWEPPSSPADPEQAVTAPALPRRTWGEFYADDRLLPYLPAARANGSIGTQGAAVIEKLAERLRSGAFDAPQPALVHTDAALLHGDLWSGNVFWASARSARQAAVMPTAWGPEPPADPDPVAVLIDPASHGGHAESDLAQLTVFGAPFAERIYAAYHEASPLADGWRERIGLHRLHILIVHAALFGGSYGAQTVEEARGYL